MKLPLETRNNQKQQAILLAAATLVFAAATTLLATGVFDRFDPLRYGVPWAAVYAFLGLALLRQTKAAISTMSFSALLVLLMAVLWVRVPLLPIQSADYADCLSEWIAAIRAIPGSGALGASIGDYNAPYFYLLVLVAKLDALASLYWLKFVSFAFEAAAAVMVMRLVSLVQHRAIVRVSALFGVLLLPTVILNGSAWAQCDAIYVLFGLAALYAGLKRKSRLSFAMFALAFSLKLQTVFFLPMALALLFTGRIRLRDAWVFAAVFVALLLPALLAGRPLPEVLSIYYRQADYYNYLQMNCYSIFGLFDSQAESTLLSYAAILAAGALTFGLLAYLWQRRSRLDNGLLLDAAYLFLLLIPFLLPHMHERYFFAADVVGIVYLMRRPKRWYIPVIGATCSLLVYLPFLFAQELALPLGVLSLAMLSVIGMVTRDFIASVEAACGPALGEAPR